MKKYMLIMVMMITALVSISCTARIAQTSSSQNLLPASISTSQSSVSYIDATAEISQDADFSGLHSLLSEDEIEGLIYMYEEEKLAHDLYQNFYDRWGLPIFQNIASSESTHMDSVAFLLQKYGIEDPAAVNPSGEFTNPELKNLYNQLVEQGSRSAADALRVAASVEEIDILDLRDRSTQTQMSDILQVYTNLENGSNNHLRSFASVLENQTGEIYSPIYLTPEDYLQIISSGMGANGQGPVVTGNGQRGPKNN